MNGSKMRHSCSVIVFGTGCFCLGLWLKVIFESGDWWSLVCLMVSSAVALIGYLGANG